MKRMMTLLLTIALMATSLALTACNETHEEPPMDYAQVTEIANS